MSVSPLTGIMCKWPQSKSNNKGRKGGFLFNKMLAKFQTKHVFFSSHSFMKCSLESQRQTNNKTIMQKQQEPFFFFFFVCCGFLFFSISREVGIEISKNVWLLQCTVRGKWSHSFSCQSAFIIFVSLHACLHSSIPKSHHSLLYPFIYPSISTVFSSYISFYILPLLLSPLCPHIHFYPPFFTTTNL